MRLHILQHSSQAWTHNPIQFTAEQPWTNTTWGNILVIFYTKHVLWKTKLKPITERGGGQGCVCTTISTMYCTQTDLKIMGCTGPHTRVYTQRTCPRSTICWAWICFICWMMPGFFFLILPELFVPWIWSNIWRYSKQSLLLLFFFFSFRLTMLFQLNLNFM